MPDPITDFTPLLDPEIAKFVNTSNRIRGAFGETPTLAEMRKGFNDTCKHFHSGHPDGITTRDTEIAGTPTRTYTTGTDSPVILYLHGGGFVFGGLDSHDDICADIAATTGLTTLSPDYALSPESRHPVALNQCLAIFDNLQTPVILAGDSAGATLAAAVTHRRRDRVLAQVLIYPWLGTPRDTKSYRRNANAPILNADAMRFFHDALTGGENSAYAPLDDPDFTALPPTLLTAAEFDPLHDDATEYAARLSADNVPHTLLEDTGLVHGHLRARHISAKAGAAFKRVTDAITAIANQQPPWNMRRSPL